jgi:Putative Ice-binding-like adhesive domain
MKISFQKQRQSEGSFLVGSLIFAILFAMALGGYLTLVEHEDQMVNRSQCWNASLAMAEAGVEEALAQVNASPSDFSANGWGKSGGDYGPMARDLTGGSYSVSIVPGAIPAIYSTGYVTVPITGNVVSRVVKVAIQDLPLFNVALGAVDNINMNGNGIATDSWNSHSSTLSNNGQYDSSRTSTNGSVASVQGLINIGNHTIDGNMYLGPTASYNNSGTVDGTIYTDYNVQFPNAVLPTVDSSGNVVTWFTAAPVGGNYNFDTPGNYTVNTSASITVQPGVAVTLHVTTQDFSPASITILGGMTNSGTVYIYQDSGTATLSGNASTGGNRPDNFYYYGLPGVTSITLSGNSTFIGVIYAPEAQLTLNGGGNANNLEGAAIVNQVTLNGHYDFHYDESLATNGPSRGYIPISWQEL